MLVREATNTKKFSAVNWIINRAQQWKQETYTDKELGEIEVKDFEFNGSLPYNMIESLYEIKKQYDNGNESLGITWYSEDHTEHIFNLDFSNSKNSTRVKAYYTKATYTDGLPF